MTLRFDRGTGAGAHDARGCRGVSKHEAAVRAILESGAGASELIVSERWQAKAARRLEERSRPDVELPRGPAEFRLAE